MPLGFTPRSIAALGALFAVLTSFACSRHEPARCDGMSVIVITIDTLRADRMSAYGYSRPTTPNLDRFAKGAVRFDRAITPMPRTTQALASLLTGKTPAQHGVLSLERVLKKSETSFVERFRDGGFTTAARLVLPFFTAKTGDQGLGQGFGEECRVFGEGRELSAGELTDRALRWLSTARDGRFLLWLHYRDPHAPYRPPAPFTEKFDPGYRGPYESGFHYFPTDGDGRIEGGEITQKMVEEKGAHKFGRVSYGDEKTIEHIKALYDGEIAYTDQEIGRLLDALPSLGLDQKTVVVLTADHGESLGEHQFWFDHGEFLYETCIHIPLIVRVPGAPPSVVPAQVGLIDVGPTLLDLFGLDALEGVPGRSFAAAFNGGAVTGRELVVESGEPLMADENPRFAGRPRKTSGGAPPQIDPGQRALMAQNGYVAGSGDEPGDRLLGLVTDARFKTILDPVAPPERQLQAFRLDDDPGELRDVSSAPESKVEVERAKSVLDRLRRK